MPTSLEYLWAYYNELMLTRRNYGWGATPLSYTEIYSWSMLRKVTLDAWELDALLKLDSIFLSSIKTKEKESEDNGSG